MAKKKRAKARVKSRSRTKPKKKSTRKRVGVKRKPAKKRTVTRKRKPAKKRKATRKRKPAAGRKLIKQVEKRSVERVMSGKRKRRRKRSGTPKKRKVVMAGSRRRSVGGLGKNGLLIGLGIGAIAFYLLTKKSTPTYPPGYQLPPLATTNNQTRNTQSNDIINYAIAGGLAIDAIIKLIGLLNSSNDQEVENIYDNVNTTGDLSVYV
jgi:hypothetical protein